MSKELDKNISVEQSMVLIEHRKPEDYKVNIWGHELCNGAEWQDFLDVVNKLGKEKADLEAKLAEKQSKIQELNDKLEWKSKWLKITDNMVGKSNQDKISFAVEQLTQFEQGVLNYVDKVYGGIGDILDKEDLDYILDNQIEELKKELNNKETKPKLIKKTLSITSELNEQAEDLGINFSYILREALKKEIKQLKERK